MLDVVGARWILLLAEADFSEELVEAACRCQRRLVLAVFWGEADSALAKIKPAPSAAKHQWRGGDAN